MDQYQTLAVLLTCLERELTRLGYWQDTSPSASALASCEPFSIDTLSCTEWLQWVFIFKMRYLIENQMTLPPPFAISPYVEMALNGVSDQQDLIQATKNIDVFFNAEDTFGTVFSELLDSITPINP